jgi:hypothetical protein
MANTVFQIKRSSVPGRIPSSSDLNVGELAINLADKILFSKDASGNVFQVSAGSSSNVTLESILLTLYGMPTGDYGLLSENTVSEFGEDLLVTYDLKTTFPSGSGVLTTEFGSLS